MPEKPPKHYVHCTLRGAGHDISQCGMSSKVVDIVSVKSFVYVKSAHRCQKCFNRLRAVST